MVARIKFFCFIIFISFSAFSQQDTMNSRIADSASYRFYNNKEWDSLINIGRLAIKSDIEYFYLDYRIGQAFFEKKNFMNATHFFEKALSFNSYDEATVISLYYSYLYSNREYEAAKLHEKYKFMRTAVPLPNRERLYGSSIYLEGGPGFSNNLSKNGNIDISGKENIYGETNRFKNMFYSLLGMEIKFKKQKRFTVFFGWSNIFINNTKEIRLGILRPFQPIMDTVVTDDYKLSQNSYYLNTRICFLKGLSLTPAFHYIYDQSSPMILNSSSVAPPLSENDFKRTDIKINNYIFSVNLSKIYSLFNLKFSSSYSILDKTKLFQGGLEITLYPMGNNNLMLSSGVCSVYNLSKGVEKKNNFVFKENICIGLTSKLWLNGGITFNGLTNYNESNGLVVFNTQDKMLSKTEAGLLFLFKERAEISLTYQLIKKENDYISYQTPDLYTINTTYYNNNLIIGGIKWKF